MQQRQQQMNQRLIQSIIDPKKGGCVIVRAVGKIIHQSKTMRICLLYIKKSKTSVFEVTEFLQGFSFTWKQQAASI